MIFVEPTPEGEALYEVLVQVPKLNRLVQSLRSREGPHWTIGLWELLRAIKIDGPRTVPQIARARGLARQRVQKIVDDADAFGLIRRRNNPDHKRSSIVALTPEGKAVFERIDSEIRQAAQEMADGLDIHDLDAALRVLFELRKNLYTLQR